MQVLLLLLLLLMIASGNNVHGEVQVLGVDLPEDLGNLFVDKVGTIALDALNGAGILDRDEEKGLVLELNEQVFEMITQASTGGTTGDWLIAFYSPSCKACHDLIKKTLPQASVDLKNYVVFGKVNGDVNPGLLKRFDVKTYPTIIMISKGVRYGPYTGTRDRASIVEWGEEGFRNDVALPVPALPTLSDRGMEFLFSIPSKISVSFEQRPMISVFALLVGGFLGCLPVILLFGLPSLSEIKETYFGNKDSSSDNEFQSLLPPSSSHHQPKSSEDEKKKKKKDD